MKIGLEIHVRVRSDKKIFSEASNRSLGLKNSRVDFYDLGLPGSMPKLNLTVLFKAIRVALLLKSKINRKISFDRKHYRYPDLPLGFQLTQFFNPLAQKGYIELQNEKKIRIKQIHIEMDAAKTSRNEKGWDIDYNRCGVPLIEIVTEPDISSEEEFILTVKKIREICLFFNISNCDLSKGDMRFDINVSSDNYLRQEIKNMNSLNFAQKAIKELNQLLSPNGTDTSNTWDFDEKTEKLSISRIKQKDYLYLREYDLPQYLISDQLKLKLKLLNSKWEKTYKLCKKTSQDLKILERGYNIIRKLSITDREEDIRKIIELAKIFNSLEKSKIQRTIKYSEFLDTKTLKEVYLTGKYLKKKIIDENILKELIIKNNMNEVLKQYLSGESKLKSALTGLAIREGYEFQSINKILNEWNEH